MNDADLELSVLEICSQGGYIAPIGAWKDTVERLHAQGLLERLDAMNYVITSKGSAEYEKRSDDEVLGVFREQQALVKPAIDGEAEDVTHRSVKMPEGASGMTITNGTITAVTISTIGPLGVLWPQGMLGKPDVT